nr:fumarylacetoacetate hydrolase family protein [Cellulomonas hominis]
MVRHVLDGATRPGAVLPGPDAPDDDRLLDLAPVVPGHDVVDLLRDPTLLDQARSAAATVDPATLPLLADARLAPPVVPGAILCIGHNYTGHLGIGVPDEDRPTGPNVFVKTPNTLSGPHDAVVIPAASNAVDYEGEIAVVIGRRAHRVPLAEAEACIGGLTLFDDVSARDWQQRTSQWTLGKCADGFGQLGPAVVTADEALPLTGRELTVERDGVVTAHASTDQMVFSPAFLVHHLSQVMTLEPGDVIATGTPAKTAAVAATHVPMRHGDAVTISVTGLGSLTTTFVDDVPPSTATPTSGGPL